MKNFNKVGAIKVTRLTFLLVVVTFILLFVVKACFVESQVETAAEDKAPSSIATTRTTNKEGKLNVNTERYYYDLGLLPPYELPELYQISTSVSDEEKEIQTEVVDSSLTITNDDVKFFDELELSYNLSSQDESISPEIEENLISPFILDQPSQEDSIVEQLSLDEDKEISQIDDSEFVDSEVDDISFDEDFSFDDDLSFDDDDFWGDDFASDFNTPLEPLLFEPLIQTQEEYDLFKPAEDGEVEEYDDDFFDDFYVAGETDMSLYEDGIYYLTLFVNGEQKGDIETKFEGDNYFIGVASLYNLINDVLSDSAINRLFVDAPEYYTVDQLIDLNVETVVDVDAFTVSMEFGIDDIPIQYLPINKVEKNTVLSRNEKYGISDANILKPSFFSFVSSLNLSSSYTYGAGVSTNTLTNSLIMSNSISIGEVGIDFSNNLVYTVDEDSQEVEISVGTWKGFFDIRDKNLRVSFGNLGSNLGTDGTAVGFTIEKNYSYGTGELLSHQYTRDYLLESDSTLYVYVNQSEPVIKKLRRGEYILKDFPLQQGANHIRIKIIPDDPTYPIILDEFDLPYDTRLLATGDYLYGLSAAISKSEREDDSTAFFRLPYIDGKIYDYDFTDFDTQFYLNLGLFDTFTLYSTFNFSVEEIQTTFEGILATMAGPFTGTFFTSFTDLYSPQVSTSLSHTVDTIIGDISSSISLDLPVWTNETGELYTSSELDLSLGYTVPIPDEYPPLSTSLSVTLNDEGVEWSSSFTSNFDPLPNVSLNSTLSVSNVDYTNELEFSLQLGVSLSLLDNLTATKSIASTGASSLSATYQPTDVDSIQFNISGIQYFTETKPTYYAGWQHTSNYFSSYLKHSVSDDGDSLTTSGSLSSALFYAGGLFAVNRTASSNFIIVKPEGDLANNPVSIGKTNSSSLNVIKTLFGNAVYTGLSANTKNNIIAYGTSESLYSSGGSFSYELNTNTRTGYAQVLYSPISFTVSGVLLQADGTPFVQYSSPIYKLLKDENGVEYLEPDEQLYLFTDVDGRFILSDVSPGTYLFDMSVDNNQWYGLYFTVEDRVNTDEKVVLLEDYQVNFEGLDTLAFDVVAAEGQEEETVGTFGDDLASDYVDIIEIGVDRFEDEETFWNEIFPPLDEDVDDLAFEDTSGDWEDTFDLTEDFGDDSLSEDTFDDEAFFDDPAFLDTADDWESSLDDTDIPVVTVNNNQQSNPNYTYVP